MAEAAARMTGTERDAVGRVLEPLGLALLGASAVLLAFDLGRSMADSPRRRGKPSADPAAALAETDRGRLADTPSEIPARGWRDILLRVYRQMSHDRVLAV